MMHIDAATQSALDLAWDKKAAEMNMGRWLSVCDTEGWGRCPENLPLLASLFGASWYFTRFVFFRGNKLAKYFDQTDKTDFSVETLRQSILQELTIEVLDDELDGLRIAKNEVMLQVLVGQLTGDLNQEQIEQALSNLAEATLWCAIQIHGIVQDDLETQIGILAMGRMAGREMNFGSDLDLIFLFPGDSLDSSAIVSRRVQKLMRHIALLSPYGTLYEIDMRLRPHGTSGTLISSASYFIQYHNERRAIWERQMMTRCRPVIDANGMVKRSFEQITSSIYSEYDQEYLRTEIVHMRKHVQDKLGRPKGKYEIKRGIGGIMDIDFLTHYLQLLHGNTHKGLQTASTRTALRQLEKVGIIGEKVCNDLLSAYDFLKKIEGRLRVFDMKTISSFSQNVGDLHVLARAVGYLETDMDFAADRFMHDYLQATQTVREYFVTTLGEI